jgi:DNA-binding transcriptional LysR family regulator
MQESFYLTRMNPIIHQFKEDYPKVKLYVESGFILEQVFDYAIDIVPRDPQRHDILYYPLVEETNLSGLQ